MGYRQEREQKTVVNGPIFAIDVECVASARSHNEREVAHVAMMDADEKVVLNLYVKPDKPVLSYLEPLTSLNEQLVSNGVSLAEAIAQVKKALPRNAILVGQNILKDVQWLGISEGTDFAGMLDLAGLFRVFNEHYHNWVYHSLHHKAKVLLGVAHTVQHGALEDTRLSIRLFKLFLELEASPADLAQAKQTLLETPIDNTFVKLNPEYEGACLGNRKSCTCGAPFFF